MTNHVAVNPIDHKALRVSHERNGLTGDGVMCCITFPDEFRNVQGEYPILFRMNESRTVFHCMALFGLENGENQFLTDNKWDARYIPLAMDIQPFLIGRPQGEGGDPKVVIDLDNDRVNEGEGERIFDDAGHPTEYLETISKKLAYLDTGFQASAGYIAVLKKYDLLEPLTIDVTMPDGSKNSLVGFHAINEEKLSGLSGEALADLQAQGYLQPTYMALASLSQLGELIRKKAKIDSYEL
ncbi:SapC family protein [Ponticaulis sp.]|uniref:SapC family protein n=1 Tax=Ponticaulis sp. TaxID=2020902 RepID=UPI00260E641A|nr:SapC family protein [Ponticaulis sp.]MDF1679072.1 SapC family protein [Ponticaulis sp.]